MKNINTFIKAMITGVLSVVVVASCSDNSDFVEQFPDINIQVEDIKNVYYYNETLVIDPTITYGEETGENLDFSYQWDLFSENELISVSENKTLEYLLDSIGVMNFNLKVTNNTTNVIQSTTFQINVESVSSQGWYVMKQTAAGNTEIDGFYVSSEIPNYNLVEKTLGAPLEGMPVGFAFSPYYKWKPSEDDVYYSSAPALVAFSEEDGLAYNVNNARTLSTLEDMFFLNPEDQEGQIKSVMISGDKVFMSKGAKVYSMNDGNPAFFPAIEGDYSVEGLATKGSYGNTLAFDSKNERYIMFGSAGYSTSDTIGFFKDQYTDFNNGLEIPVNNMNGQAIFLENTQRGSGYSSTTYAYSLFRKHDDQDALFLYGFDYDKFVEGFYYYYPNPGDYSNYTLYKAGRNNPITFEKRLSHAEYAMLTSAGFYAMNKGNNILYFANSSSIGLYNMDSDTYNPSFIKNIPAGEEITYLKYINTNFSSLDPNFTGLVVATYQSGTDTYKIYRYQLNGLSTVELQDDIKTGQGKVSDVLYVSASSYSWSSQLYQYN
ncbi:PKD-like family lipoprotein [Aestuariibaculum sp. M13]|uniref:PKD-like family lipoprotein n=1 Tax=Aestuariibaculum sp. M13 TaxID=2967132 RepID=UPI002159F4A6|nr:PKD-like family lipoprotein [Aestuariibaculum sp. M13]MCR8668026.1 PKD-like family lipoprotein [Aestuariibaculum sp. M13]